MPALQWCRTVPLLSHLSRTVPCHSVCHPLAKAGAVTRLVKQPNSQTVTPYGTHRHRTQSKHPSHPIPIPVSAAKRTFTQSVNDLSICQSANLSPLKKLPRLTVTLGPLGFNLDPRRLEPSTLDPRRLVQTSTTLFFADKRSRQLLYL
jgi:hypothetical protein